MMMNLYLLSRMTWSGAPASSDDYRERHHSFGIDIVIEQDEHGKFGGPLLKITQRSYCLSTSDQWIRICMSPKEG